MQTSERDTALAELTGAVHELVIATELSSVKKVCEQGVTNNVLTNQFTVLIAKISKMLKIADDDDRLDRHCHFQQ